MSLKDSITRQHGSLVLLAFVFSLGLVSPAMARRVVPASPADGQTLGGLTSQQWPVVVEISRTGKRIPLISAGIDLTCPSGLDLPIPDQWDNVPIGPGGAVSASMNVPPDPGASLSRGTDTLTGKFNRKRGAFSGVWRVEARFSLSNGQTDDCQSGAVTFTAVL
jgi:hypothetical protein